MAAGSKQQETEASAAVAVCNALVRGDATTMSTWVTDGTDGHLTWHIPPRAGVSQSQSQFRATCRSISYKKSPSLTRIWYPSSGMNPVMPQSYPLQKGGCTSHQALLKSRWRPTFAVCSSRSKIWKKKLCWPKIGTSKLFFFLVNHHKIYAIFGMLKVAPPPRLWGFRAHLFSLKTLTAVGIAFQLEGQKAPKH